MISPRDLRHAPAGYTILHGSVGSLAVVGLLQKQGLEPSPSMPAELAQYMEREYETWGKVVKQAGIKAQ